MSAWQIRTRIIVGTATFFDAFDALELLQNIERHRVTHIFLPPTALYGMLAHPRVAEFDYSSLRRMLLAAAPVSPDKLRKAVEVFGPCVCQSYGQTEAPMYMTYLDTKTVAAAAAGDHPERLRSCGKVTPAVRLAIMDDDGKLLPPHKPGEIVARGALVCGGYYDLPEATSEIRTFGWHHTGDVGYRDEEGFFYIVDRKKDMIITGGFNVYCAEVEACVMELPQVRECAVVGVPDEKWGEGVKAIVVLRDGDALTEDAIIAHCKSRLGSVKSPKSVDDRLRTWVEVRPDSCVELSDWTCVEVSAARLVAERPPIWVALRPASWVVVRRATFVVVSPLSCVLVRLPAWVEVNSPTSPLVSPVIWAAVSPCSWVAERPLTAILRAISPRE